MHRNLQFPVKSDFKHWTWLDQVQSPENSCFSGSWHIIIHRCRPSCVSSSPRIHLISVNSHSGTEQLNVPIHYETQSLNICEAKWFPPLINVLVNQANWVSCREWGLLVSRVASKVTWEIKGSEPKLKHCRRHNFRKFSRRDHAYFLYFLHPDYDRI